MFVQFIFLNVWLLICSANCAFMVFDEMTKKEYILFFLRVAFDSTVRTILLDSVLIALLLLLLLQKSRRNTQLEIAEFDAKL